MLFVLWNELWLFYHWMYSPDKYWVTCILCMSSLNICQTISSFFIRSLLVLDLFGITFHSFFFVFRQFFTFFNLSLNFFPFFPIFFPFLSFFSNFCEFFPIFTNFFNSFRIFTNFYNFSQPFLQLFSSKNSFPTRKSCKIPFTSEPFLSSFQNFANQFTCYFYLTSKISKKSPFTVCATKCKFSLYGPAMWNRRIASSIVLRIKMEKTRIKNQLTNMNRVIYQLILWQLSRSVNANAAIQYNSNSIKFTTSSVETTNDTDTSHSLWSTVGVPIKYALSSVLSMITCFQFEMRKNAFASISFGKICFVF